MVKQSCEHRRSCLSGVSDVSSDEPKRTMNQQRHLSVTAPTALCAAHRLLYKDTAAQPVLPHRQLHSAGSLLRCQQRKTAGFHGTYPCCCVTMLQVGTCSKSSLARACGGGLPSPLSAVKWTLDLEPLALPSRDRLATITAAAIQCHLMYSMYRQYFY